MNNSKSCLGAGTVRCQFLIAALVASFASILAAERNQTAGDFTLTVAADRAAAIYKQGEPVAFTIKLTHQGSPVTNAQVNWTISKDGVAPTTSGQADLSRGTATVTGKLDEPGFLQCQVTFATPGKSNFTAFAGAAVDPLQIKPSLPPPDDFDAFWTGEKRKLATVSVNPRLTPQKSLAKGVEAFDLQLDSIGKPVSGYFARPIGAKPKSLPIILTVHAAGVLSSSLDGATGWAAENFLALDINAHGISNGQPREFYADLGKGELKDYRSRGCDSRETIYFHDMFLRLVRALDFLTAQPEWDGRTVVVHGRSQGGYQSIVAAGLDPRVTFFAAGVPAGCDHTGFKAGRISGWPKFITTGETPDPKVVETVRYYDAVNFATRTKAAGIITVGFIDQTCPPTGVYAAYNAPGGKREIFDCVFTGHTNTPPAMAAMRNAILAHVEWMSQPQRQKNP